MKTDFDTLWELEEILPKLLFVRDNLQALNEACSDTPFQFPKNALMLPSFTLTDIVNEYVALVERLRATKTVKNNAG